MKPIAPWVYGDESRIKSYHCFLKRQLRTTLKAGAEAPEETKSRNQAPEKEKKMQRHMLPINEEAYEEAKEMVTQGTTMSKTAIITAQRHMREPTH